MFHRNTNNNVNGSVPKWRKSTRIERIDKLELNGTTERIFPLLCPVLEYDWIRDWRCTMCYSDSGIAEMDTVFHTIEQMGRTAVWTCITYEPDTFIEYLVVSGKDVVMRLSLSLEQKSREKSVLTWRMLFTMTSHPGRVITAKTFSEENFLKLTKTREKEINKYLEHGAMFWKK